MNNHICEIDFISGGNSILYNKAQRLKESVVLITYDLPLVCKLTFQVSQILRLP